MKIKIFFTKIILIFIFLINIIIANSLKADLKVITTSIWDFWNFTSFNKEYSNLLYFTGNTKALLISQEDYNKIRLYFGINSSRDANFNYIDSKDFLFYGNLYIDTDLNPNGLLSLGFKSGELTKTNILISRGYGLGIPVFPLYSNYKNTLKNKIIFDGSYMQTNEAFSIVYSHKIWLGSTNIGISYTPNLDCNLSNTRSVYRDLQKNLGVLDSYINYYNEYRDIGYGLIGSARIYSKNFIKPEGAEFFISPNIDYLGFGLSLSFLGGLINGFSNKLSYKLSEIILYYSVLKFNVSASYGYNTISNSNKQYENYYYNNLNLSVGYLLNSKFTLKGGLFYNKTVNYKGNRGVSFGFNIKV